MHVPLPRHAARSAGFSRALSLSLLAPDTCGSGRSSLTVARASSLREGFSSAWWRAPRMAQTSRSSLGGTSQRRPALMAGNRPPKPDHSISAPNPTQHGTMRRSGNTNTGNELGATTSSISEPYMPACTTNPAVPAMSKQPTPSRTASGRSAIDEERAVCPLRSRSRVFKNGNRGGVGGLFYRLLAPGCYGYLCGSKRVLLAPASFRGTT
jgi:hypothetical protein